MSNFFKKPNVDFLLIDDDIKWTNDFKSAFDRYKPEFEKNHNINLNLIDVQISPSIKIDEVNGIINNPGNVLIELLKQSFTYNCQGILLDWELNSRPEKSDLILKIKEIRPEIPIYILTSIEDGTIIYKEDGKKNIDEFFNKPTIEVDFTDLISRLVTRFNMRRRSPFWDNYRKYIVQSYDTWHTPGHSGGYSFLNSEYISSFYDFYGSNTFKGDLSVSVGSLGSLLDSTSYIGEAQDKAAITFGAKQTFFVTNGSSTANKIIIQSVLKPGDKVLVDRNCHKSVHYGIIQSGAEPLFLESEFNSKLGIFAPPTYNDIEEQLTKNEIKLLILTGCTYEGILSDINSIVEVCHLYKTKVLIDEAWFAYSKFHPNYIKYSAVMAKADYVTHSSHKVLSAFSQASMIHVNDPDFDIDFFREIFYIYTSTSPQYQIIASLDVASTQMLMEGFKLIDKTIVLAKKFRNDVKNDLKYFKIIDKDALSDSEVFPHLKFEQFELDVLKVLIDFSATGLESSEILSEIKNEALLEIEKSTHSTFLVLFTIGTKNEKIIRLYSVLKNIENRLGSNPTIKINSNNNTIQIPKKIELKQNPAKVFFGKRIKVEIDETENKISAGLVTPYPPGIPILVPGQLIKIEHINYLKSLLDKNTEIHGLFHGCIYISDTQ